MLMEIFICRKFRQSSDVASNASHFFSFFRTIAMDFISTRIFEKANFHLMADAFSDLQRSPGFLIFTIKDKV